VIRTTGATAVAGQHVQLRVDWPACKAHEVCHQLLPELISLDEWGYPIVAGREVPAHYERQAGKAVHACPALALRLVPAYT
jgi:ferredoxin